MQAIQEVDILTEKCAEEAETDCNQAAAADLAHVSLHHHAPGHAPGHVAGHARHGGDPDTETGDSDEDGQLSVKKWSPGVHAEPGHRCCQWSGDCLKAKSPSCRKKQ